jgi:hypothetical protein
LVVDAMLEERLGASKPLFQVTTSSHAPGLLAMPCARLKLCDPR